MSMVYGHMVRAVSGKLMAVVTNNSTSMSLEDYAIRTEMNYGISPVLATKEEIGAYEVVLTKIDVDICNSDPYVRSQTVAFDKDDAIILARKILTYYGEEL